MKSRIFIPLAALALSLIPLSQAQLAITEVLSSGSTNLGPAQVIQNSDYWELTNFGTNQVDLTGYKFDDGDNNLAAGDSLPFQGLLIGPGESILFVQNNVNTNAAAVREWWGTNLNASVKIAFYSGNGFSSTGDGVRLWAPTAQVVSDVVDSVDFGEAVRGVAFTYDSTTGEFGISSTNGVSGAFKAALTDDVGSPGKNAGPTPLKFLQQPANVVVNPGDNAQFTVAIQGRPRGRIQWFFKGAPLSGANQASLQITNVQAAVSGAYYATVNNGVQTVTSATAELVLQSQASAPAITASPADATLTEGQSLTFKVTATGVPQPSYEWRLNGKSIDGATSAEYQLAGAALDQSGEYSIVARNQLGSVTNSFRVNVTAPPQLVITEIMSSSSTNVAGHQDWWELSNLGAFPVSLKGYRFDDNSESLAAAFTFTNDVTIAPGESVIFVETMTPEAFREWWGLENLPANLQILTYRGNGLSSAGDAVNVWNAAAVEDSDKIASAVFSTATAGVSFGYNSDTGTFGALSSKGSFGAVSAASGGDIGSPGVIRNRIGPIPPRITSFIRNATGLQMQWTSSTGASYELQSRDSLAAGPWTTVKTVNATGSLVTEELPLVTGVAQRYYRVLVR